MTAKQIVSQRKHGAGLAGVGVHTAVIPELVVSSRMHEPSKTG